MLITETKTHEAEVSEIISNVAHVASLPFYRSTNPHYTARSAPPLTALREDFVGIKKDESRTAQISQQPSCS